MKFREGFVTNSSSTNFLIISKKELDAGYLAKKMGFKENTKLYRASYELIQTILSAVENGPRYHQINEINYDVVKEIFGQESADKYEALMGKGFHAYIGYTSSDDDYLTAFMTMDHFIIDDKDFYMNGESCVW